MKLIIRSILSLLLLVVFCASPRLSQAIPAQKDQGKGMVRELRADNGNNGSKENKDNSGNKPEKGNNGDNPNKGDDGNSDKKDDNGDDKNKPDKPEKPDKPDKPNKPERPVYDKPVQKIIIIRPVIIDRKVIVVRDKTYVERTVVREDLAVGPDWATRVIVYGALTSTSFYSTPVIGSEKYYDAGSRFGLGASLNKFISHSAEMEIGYTYFFNQGSFNIPQRILTGAYPVYLNLLFHSARRQWGTMYFGGGINYSFFSVYNETTSTDLLGRGELGFQFVGGADSKYWRWEFGAMFTNGSYSLGGVDHSASNNGVYFKLGFKII